MSKKYFSLILVLSLISFQAFPQSFARKYINSILNDTSEISRPQFLVYPTLAYAPETSWEIGLSSLFVYYAKRDTTNRLSEINGFTFFTLENQYGLWFDHAILIKQMVFPGQDQVAELSAKIPWHWHGYAKRLSGIGRCQSDYDQRKGTEGNKEEPVFWAGGGFSAYIKCGFQALRKSPGF